MLHAERDLIRARLAADDSDATAAASFTAAIAGLREQSTPYHLAHGLLDHAEYLMAAGSAGDAALAASAVAEARDIAGRLRCQPLLDRADTLTPRGFRHCRPTGLTARRPLTLAIPRPDPLRCAPCTVWIRRRNR
jgi:hypothetical protein